MGSLQDLLVNTNTILMLVTHFFEISPKFFIYLAEIQVSFTGTFQGYPKHAI